MQTEVRRYHVIEAVGKGGFGTVYKAQLLGVGGFQKTVALKVLNPDVAEQHDFAERLRDEARMLGLLHHRAIVRVDGLLLLNSRWTVVMEYVEGVDLKGLLGSGPLPIAPAIEIIQEVCGALHNAYDVPVSEGGPLRLLHRDIKPSNIQLTSSGEVKVLDFGVARAEFQHRESVTQSIFFGSLAYMAPERLDGIDTHSGDIYALGAVLFELITGEPLGRTSGNRERHTAHVEAALDQLWERARDEELIELMADTLAYEESRRPSARDLERRLRTIRMRYPEPWLKDFAESIVPDLVASRPEIVDDLSGSILVEQADISGSFPEDAEASTSFAGPPAVVEDEESGGRGAYLIGIGAMVVGALIALIVGGGAVGAVWMTLTADPVADPETPPPYASQLDAVKALAEGGDPDVVIDDGVVGSGSGDPVPAAGDRSAQAGTATAAAEDDEDTGDLDEPDEPDDPKDPKGPKDNGKATGSAAGTNAGGATTADSTKVGSAAGGSSSGGTTSGADTRDPWGTSSGSASSSSSSGGSSGGSSSASSSSGGSSGGSSSAGSSSAGSSSAGSSSAGSSSAGSNSGGSSSAGSSSGGSSTRSGGLFSRAQTPPPRGGPRGTVRVVVKGSGTAEVRFEGDGGSYAPGTVPAGSFRVLGAFNGVQPVYAGDVVVHEGQTITISCRPGLSMCTVPR